MVSGDFWGSGRRPFGIPASAFAGVPDSGRRVLPDGIARSKLAGTGPKRGTAVRTRGVCPDAAGARRFDGKTVRGGDDGTGVKRQRALPRLFDLLHAGEHRGFLRAAHGLSREAAPERGKRVSSFRGQRAADVLRGLAFLPRAEEIGRSAHGKPGGNHAELSGKC